jgi:hypothetical protein
MLHSRLILILAALALSLASGARAAVTVFQNPLNNPTPAAPVTIVAGGPPVVLNVFYDAGSNASSGCPGVPPTCNRCLSGTGDEVCGWDIHIGTSNPLITLTGFAPDTSPGSDVVWAISGNVLRANGGNPLDGELGVHRIGAVTVTAAPGASGNVLPVGNLYAGADLGAYAVSVGNFLGTVGTEPDTDGDLIPDTADNCPTVANADQADVGEVNAGGVADGVGDVCDNCTATNNPRVPSWTLATGGTDFLASNQWATLSGGQRDDDHDGYGNKCDAQFPGHTGVPNVGSQDLTQYRASSGKSRAIDTCGTTGTVPCAIFDLNENIGGLPNIDSNDLNQYRSLSGKAPGPRCTTHCTGSSATLPCQAGTAGTCSP